MTLASLKKDFLKVTAVGLSFTAGFAAPGFSKSVDSEFVFSSMRHLVRSFRGQQTALPALTELDWVFISDLTEESSVRGTEIYFHLLAPGEDEPVDWAGLLTKSKERFARDYDQVVRNSCTRQIYQHSENPGVWMFARYCTDDLMPGVSVYLGTTEVFGPSDFSPETYLLYDLKQVPESDRINMVVHEFRDQRKAALSANLYLTSRTGVHSEAEDGFPMSFKSIFARVPVKYSRTLTSTEPRDRPNMATGPSK